jgi:hypothetical protein
MKTSNNNPGLDLLLSVAAEADTDLTEAKRIVEEKLNKRSEVIKRIKSLYGTGPFTYLGAKVMIIERGETFFFRTKN